MKGGEFMSLTNKEVCKRLIDKGNFKTVLCQLCRTNMTTCEVRKEWEEANGKVSLSTSQ